MRIKCGGCGEIYDIYATMGGSLFVCQTCGATIRMPETDGKDVNDLKLCHFCKKLIDSNVAVCPYCDELLLDWGKEVRTESEKSRKIYILLALLFGVFGIHNLYAGRRKAGFIQFFMGISILLLLPALLWSLLDIFLVTEDGGGQRMR